MHASAGRRTLIILNLRPPKTEQILGIPFFNGSASEAVARIAQKGGLVVAPSGTCFERFMQDEDYRRAILTADLVLPDSGFMVSLWRLLRRRRLQRISGLAYLKQLLAQPEMPGSAYWILPNERSRHKLMEWARRNGVEIGSANFYLAPIYGRQVEDQDLLTLIDERRPRHIVVGVGAGPQEKLGWYLREQASYRPAIHCIGGALGFVTGDQVAIPQWADRLFLGWFLRLLSQPRTFLPRLPKAWILPGLIAAHGEQLPPMKSR